MKKHRKIIAVLLLTVLFFGFVSPVTTFTTEAAGYYPRIKEKNLTLQVGKSKKLTITNDDGLKKKFKSKDKTIAKVSKTGKITGVKKGETDIVVTFSAPKKDSYDTVVHVKVKPKPFTSLTITHTIENLTQYRIWVKSADGKKLSYHIAISTESESKDLNLKIYDGILNYKNGGVMFVGDLAQINSSQKKVEITSNKDVVWIDNRSGVPVEVTITISTDKKKKMKDVDFDEAKLTH